MGAPTPRETLGDAIKSPRAGAQGALLLVYKGDDATGEDRWERVRYPSKFIMLTGTPIGSIITLWTPTTGKRFNLMGGEFSINIAASVLFEDNVAGGGIIAQTPKLQADTPFPLELYNGRTSGAVNRVLKATASATGTVATGMLWGTEE